MFSKKIFLKNLSPRSKKDSELIRTVDGINRWAIEEAFLFIKEHPNLPIEEALSLFISDMDRYSCEARSGNSSFIFSMAKSMAEDILDHWIVEQSFGKEDCFERSLRRM